MSAKPAPDASLYEQLLALQTAAGSGSTARPSAAVVPWRRRDDETIEVYWVKRSPKLRFMGGWHAFPGGGLSRRDAAVKVHGSPSGCASGRRSLAQPPGLDSDELDEDLIPGLIVCALRELFEETGLLLLRPGQSPAPEAVESGRRELLAKKITFAALLQSWAVELDAEQLVFAGRWLTPPLAPMGFDNRFFLLPWPTERSLQPSIIDGELVEGEWIQVRRALELWRQSEVMIAPPIVHLLRVLAEEGPEAGLVRLRHPVETCWAAMRHIEFRPGIHLLPVRTPTLPPATHTNTMLLGRRSMVLVDPATPIPSEQRRLLDALHAARDRGAEIEAIWLTHHHMDHIGAVGLTARELNLPVFAHAASRAPLAAAGIPLDGELQDGQRVILDGDPPCVITVHHTPGHTQGHLSFMVEDHRSLIIGDLVSALSTIVIDPPEGDMAAYLASLEAMAKLRPRVLFPSHGPVILDAVGKLEAFLVHRREREEQVRDLWLHGVRDTGAMVRAIYTELPEMAHGIAERQILAHLEHLRRLGRIDGS